MSTTTNQAAISLPSNPAPLARDTDGNPIALPEGAAAWRVRRHTRGRPKVHRDSNKQPMRFPLHYTIEDVEEVLAPGTYWLDLVNDKDTSLEVTVQLAIGPRGEADAGDDEPTQEVNLLPSSGSDIRLVLEANVRATQMAFLHNQKTLEIGMRMAESLRDGVHVLADAQADWIKSMASARGFFRNAAPLALPPPPEPANDDDDDDDEPEQDDKDSSGDWIDRLTPLIGMVAPKIVEVVMGMFSKSERSDVKIELADLADWRRIEKKRNAAIAAKETASPTAAPTPILDTPPDPLAMLRVYNALNDELRAKLDTLRERFTADEHKKIFAIVMGLPLDELPSIIADLTPKPVDELEVRFRAMLANVGAS